MQSSAGNTTTNLGVDNPAIPSVFDTERGEEIHTGQLLCADEADVMRLRFEIKKWIQNDRARYLCPECFVPLSLVSRKETRRFFFRHLIEDGRCSAITRGELSQADINARKYNGAKESYLHREMKQWLVDSLGANGRFTSVAQEARWTGPITGAWRKPDVSAMYGDLKIAFEVQLSTTFLDVIAERWRFYQREGGLLFWVFARFDDDGRRLTQDDVFFNNNQNAFIVSKATRDASISIGEFLLDCAWSEPDLARATPRIYRARVPFSQLTLDLVQQQAYYFDYRGKKAQLEAEYEQERQSWPTQFEQWWLEIADQQTSQYDQEDALRDFPSNAPRYWSDWGMLDESPLRNYGRDKRLPVAMLNAFYSAKHGRPVGIRRRLFIEVAHYLAESYPEYLRWFRRALETYKRGELLKQQDVSGKWKARRIAYQPLLNAHDKKYEPDARHHELFSWLFPELKPLPLPH